MEPKLKKEKKSKEAEEVASRNLSLMIISIGILFFIGNAPNSIGFILKQYVNNSSVFYTIYKIIANLTLFTSQGCDIFIYYKFNKQYHKILAKLLGFKM